MLIYIDESGTVNNFDHSNCPYTVIALVHVKDKIMMQRAYDYFVKTNLDRLRELDKDKIDAEGRVIKTGGQMFVNGKLMELKGACFDSDMKRRFLSFFGNEPYFEVFYIKIVKSRYSGKFYSNAARMFNYSLKLGLSHFTNKKLLPYKEECILQLDERNEKPETRYFLEEYLNTELTMKGRCKGPFKVHYLNSANNKIIQITDVYANWFYSQLQTGAYDEELKTQQETGIIREIFEVSL